MDQFLVGCDKWSLHGKPLKIMTNELLTTIRKIAHLLILRDFYINRKC